MKRAIMRKGFTLVEIMIVVGIVLLLAAIAIPNLLRARIVAQEGAAIGAIRALVSAEASYRATHSSYANLTNLFIENPPYIDSILASGNKQGYSYSVEGASSSLFYILANYQIPSKASSFYGDEDGLVCRSNTSNATMPNSHIGSGCPAGFSEVE
jgi:type IV pilus assembly protein PilA